MSTVLQAPAQVQAELAEHRRAMDDYLATARRVSPDAWNRAPAEGKWTPAQVTEHLRLTYLTIGAEMDGQAGFRIRTSWWRQRLYRILLLPNILKSGQFPAGVPAVREIRPGDGPYDQAEHLRSFEDEGERFMERFRAPGGDPRRVLAHPFLGRLTLLEGLRFTTQHIRHHHPQIAGPAGEG
jgi:hypothetical protein